MSTESLDGSPSRQTAKLVRKFDRSLRRTADLLVDKFGEENAPVIRRETLAEFRRLIPEIPYIEGRRNPYSQILVGAAPGLAMYRAVVRHGGSLQDTGELMHRRNRAQMQRIPRVVRHSLMRNLFVRQQERAARRSQAASGRVASGPPNLGGWDATDIGVVTGGVDDWPDAGCGWCTDGGGGGGDR